MGYTVEGVAKSRTRLNDFHFHAHEVYDQRVVLSSFLLIQNMFQYNNISLQRKIMSICQHTQHPRKKDQGQKFKEINVSFKIYQ